MSSCHGSEEQDCQIFGVAIERALPLSWYRTLPIGVRIDAAPLLLTILEVDS